MNRFLLWILAIALLLLLGECAVEKYSFYHWPNLPHEIAAMEKLR